MFHFVHDISIGSSTAQDDLNFLTLLPVLLSKEITVMRHLFCTGLFIYFFLDFFFFLRNCFKAGKVVQLVKVLAMKADQLISASGPHMEEGDHQPLYAGL